MADYQSTVEIRANTSQLERKMAGMQRSIAQTNTAISKTQGAFAKLGATMSSGYSKASAAIDKHRGKLIGLGVAVGGITAKGISDFKKYEAALLQIGTLGVKNLKQVESSVNDLTKAHGVNSQQALKGYYDIVSAGASEGAQAMGQLEAASKLAAAGNTELAGAVDILTTGINVFGDNGETAITVADKIFTTVKLGKTTVKELGSTFGLVAATADAAGISLGETGAALAVMTAGGLRTSVAVTGLKAALSNIIKVTPKASKTAERLGIEFNQAALASKGFVAFFQEIKQKTGGSVTELGKLFDSVEAINAIASITSDTGIKKLDHAFKAMGTSANTINTEFDKVEKGVGVQLRKLTASVGEFSRAIGKTLVPGVIELVALTQPMFEFFTKIIEANPGLVKVTGQIGALALALGLLGLGPTAALAALALVFKKFGDHYGVFSDGAAAFKKLSDDILLLKNSVKSTVSKIKEIFSSFLDGPVTAIKKSIAVIKEAFYDLYMYLVGGSVVPDIADGVEYAFGRVTRAFNKLTNTVKGWVNGVKRAFKQSVSDIEGYFNSWSWFFLKLEVKFKVAMGAMTVLMYGYYAVLKAEEAYNKALDNLESYWESAKELINDNLGLIEKIAVGVTTTMHTAFTSLSTQLQWMLKLAKFWGVAFVDSIDSASKKLIKFNTDLAKSMHDARKAGVKLAKDTAKAAKKSKEAIEEIADVAKQAKGDLKELKLSDDVAKGFDFLSERIENSRAHIDRLGKLMLASRLPALAVPILIAINWEQIKEGVSEISTALGKGDLLGGLDVLVKGADNYISGFIDTISALFGIVVSILTADMGELLDRFGLTFGALTNAVDSFRNEISGLLNAVLLPLQVAIETLYDFVQGVLSIFTGIDGESVIGSLIASFLTFKLVVFALTSSIQSLWLGIQAGRGINIGDMYNTGGLLFDKGAEFGVGMAKMFASVGKSAMRSFSLIRAGFAGTFSASRTSSILTGFHMAFVNTFGGIAKSATTAFGIAKASAIKAFAAISTNFKLFKISIMAHTGGLLKTALFGKYGIATLLSKLVGFLSTVTASVRSTIASSTIFGSMMERITIGKGGMLAKLLLKIKGFMLGMSKVVKYGIAGAIGLFALSATAGENPDSPEGSAPDAELDARGIFDDFGGLLSIALITVLSALPYGKIFKKLGPIFGKIIKSGFVTGLISGIKVIGIRLLALIGGIPTLIAGGIVLAIAAIGYAIYKLVPLIWSLLKSAGGGLAEGIWEGAKYIISGKWLDAIYNFFAANDLEEAIIDTAALSDKLKEVDIDIPVNLEFDDSRIQSIMKDKEGFWSNIWGAFTDTPQVSVIERIMPRDDVEAIGNFYGSQLPGYLKSLEKVKPINPVDARALTKTTEELRELEKHLQNATANKLILTQGLLKGEGDESIITERLNATESLAVAEAQILAISKQIQEKTMAAQTLTLEEYRTQVRYQKLLKERGIFLPTIYKDTVGYAKDLAKYDAWILGFSSDTIKFQDKINKQLEKAGQLKANLGKEDKEHLANLEKMLTFETKAAEKALGLGPKTEVDKTYVDAEKKIADADKAYNKLLVAEKARRKSGIITEEEYLERYKQLNIKYNNKAAQIVQERADAILAIEEALQSKITSMLGRYGDKETARMAERAKELKNLTKLIEEADKLGKPLTVQQIETIELGITKDTLAEKSKDALAFFEDLEKNSSKFADTAVGRLLQEQQDLRDHYAQTKNDKDIANADKLIADNQYAAESIKIDEKLFKARADLARKLESYLRGLDRSTATLTIQLLDNGVDKNLATQKLSYENSLQDLKLKHEDEIRRLEEEGDKASIIRANKAHANNLVAQEKLNQKKLADIERQGRRAAAQKAIKSSNFGASTYADTNLGLEFKLEANLGALKEQIIAEFKEAGKDSIEALEHYNRRKLNIETAHYESIIALKKKQIEKQRSFLLETGDMFDGIRVGIHDFFKNMETEAQLFSKATADSLTSLKDAILDLSEGKSVDFKEVIGNIFKKFSRASLENSLNDLFKNVAESLGFKNLDGLVPADGSKKSPYYVHVMNQANDILDAPTPKVTNLMDGYATKYGTDPGSKQTQMLAEQGMDFEDVVGAVNNNTTGLGSIFEGGFGSFGDMFSRGLDGLGSLFSEGFSGLGNWFSSIFSSGGGAGGGGGIGGMIGGLFGGGGGGLGGLFGGGGGGHSMIDGIGVSGFGGGGGIGGFISGLFGSTGGMVTNKGIVPMSYFANGGFARGTDTVPAMLTPGEMVLTADQQAMMGAGGGVTINQTLNITEAMDPQKFQQELVKNNKVVVGLVQQSYQKRGQMGPQGYGR